MIEEKYYVIFDTEALLILFFIPTPMTHSDLRALFLSFCKC